MVKFAKPALQRVEKVMGEGEGNPTPGIETLKKCAVTAFMREVYANSAAASEETKIDGDDPKVVARVDKILS